MPAYKPKKILQFLEQKGFFVARQSGSHVILHKKGDQTKRVTLPFHNKDLKPGTLTSILKQAGVDKRELKN